MLPVSADFAAPSAAPASAPPLAQPLNIAIVGIGPTGIYLLHRLIAHPRPMFITLFEAASLAGVGSPYSPETAQAAMLANIASIEIPPLGESYLDWLRREPPAFLRAYGVEPDSLNARQFLPRILLGGWFRSALGRLIAEGEARGHRIQLREGCRVTDVVPLAEGQRVVFANGPQAAAEAEQSLLFSHVVLATGHVWPEEGTGPAGQGYFVSPWTGLIEADVPACRVGILGSSLSAIDAAMAIACKHGRFHETGSDLRFEPAAGSGGLHLTLMSRNGLLPEADFWCPIPYRANRYLTAAALDRAVRAGGEGLLDRVWPLFVAELSQADPAYAEAIGLSRLGPDSFAEAYFAARLAADPFDWAARNLAEAEENAARRQTVEWRYAILRMHEPMETIVAAFTEADRARFEALRRVFTDNYAAVPPQSIRRLLALHRAGVLSLLPLGEEYRIADQSLPVQIDLPDGARHQFDVFVDARGQQRLGPADLPFAGLRAWLPQEAQDLPLTRDFALCNVGQGRIFLPAAPYLLSRLPFVQGIVSSHDMAGRVAAALLAQDPGAEQDRATEAPPAVAIVL